MPQNPFDKASRYLANLDPAAFLAWATGVPAERLAFRRWLDTRAVPFPGDADRTGDTVARAEDPAGTEPPWAVAVEFQIEPDPLMFGRLLCYLGQLWLALKPDPGPGSRFHLAAVVVNLTGAGDASRDMRRPDAGFVTQLAVVERNLAGENADTLLAGVEGGRWSRALLPWLPLMTGGDDPGIIDRWKKLAEGEPDRRRKADYALLALTFAGAAKRKAIWARALEGWNMIESEVANEWMAVGRVAEAAAAVIAVLEAKYGSIPAEVDVKIRDVADLTTLKNWVPLAVTTATLDEFRHTAGL